MQKFVFDFIAHCGIPADKLRYLRWNDVEQGYLEPDDGGKFTLFGAFKFDDDEQSWRLGISIILSQTQWVAFGLTLAELNDGKWMVKVAGDKSSRPFDTSDSTQCNQLYDDIVTKISASYKTRKSTPERVIGFKTN